MFVSQGGGEGDELDLVAAQTLGLGSNVVELRERESEKKEL